MKNVKLISLMSISVVMLLLFGCGQKDVSNVVEGNAAEQAYVAP